MNFCVGISRRHGCMLGVDKPSEQGHPFGHPSRPIDRDQHYLLTGWQCGDVLSVTLDRHVWRGSWSNRIVLGNQLCTFA